MSHLGSPTHTLSMSLFRKLTIDLRFSTRWMPTMPRNAPKLSCRHKDAGKRVDKQQLRGENERGVNDSRWCRGNIRRRARCLCGWRRSDRWSRSPETKPAETRSPRGPISCDAGTELRTGERTAVTCFIKRRFQSFVDWQHAAFPNQAQWVRARNTPWTPVHHRTHTRSADLAPGNPANHKSMHRWPVLGLFLLIFLHIAR